MKLRDLKEKLLSAPEAKPSNWKKPLSPESMNCPECLGSGKADAKPVEGPPLKSCASCLGSGLQLSGKPKSSKHKDRYSVKLALDDAHKKTFAGLLADVKAKMEARREFAKRAAALTSSTTDFIEDFMSSMEADSSAVATVDTVGSVFGLLRGASGERSSKDK